MSARKNSGRPNDEESDQKFCLTVFSLTPLATTLGGAAVG